MKMILTNKEFYSTPNGEVMIEGTEGTKILGPSDRAFVSAMMEKIHEFWPWSLPPLCKKFEKLMSHPATYEFRIVRHWIKCNLGNYDGVLDIDQLGNFHLEIVSCPLRGGDCTMEGDFKSENCVCRPKFNSQLSDSELKVMNLYYDGLNTENIADKLCLSQDTIRTHKRNSFKRIAVHSLPEFLHYARKNSIFK